MLSLTKIERQKLQALIDVPIPAYILGAENDEQIDLLYEYEMGFMFAHDLMKNHTISSSVSPWGEKEKIKIFDAAYIQKLQDILSLNISDEMNEYCKVYLDALQVFKAHLS